MPSRLGILSDLTKAVWVLQRNQQDRYERRGGVLKVLGTSRETRALHAIKPAALLTGARTERDSTAPRATRSRRHFSSCAGGATTRF